MRRQQSGPELTSEELEQQEEEKYLRVAALRRKFKEQNRKILEALSQKKQEEALKAEEAALKEQLRRAKHRKK